MRNLGPKSSAWLNAVGIHSLADLRDLGAVAAYLKVKHAGFNTSLNLLWALAGALNDCDWKHLPEGEKTALLLALDAAEMHP